MQVMAVGITSRSLVATALVSNAISTFRFNTLVQFPENSAAGVGLW